MKKQNAEFYVNFHCKNLWVCANGKKLLTSHSKYFKNKLALFFDWIQLFLVPLLTHSVLEKERKLMFGSPGWYMNAKEDIKQRKQNCFWLELFRREKENGKYMEV